ncbi:hypothetical protein CCP3SC1_170017 [Gammaproteobacteria bacterium]
MADKYLGTLANPEGEETPRDDFVTMQPPGGASSVLKRNIQPGGEASDWGRRKQRVTADRNKTIVIPKITTTRRRKRHEESENHERWLVSYADFITLLFAFFVVMYAISSVNEGKYRVLSESMVAAFRSSPKSLEPIQVGQLVKSPVPDKIERDAPPPPRYLSPGPSGKA